MADDDGERERTTIVETGGGGGGGVLAVVLLIIVVLVLLYVFRADLGRVASPRPANGRGSTGRDRARLIVRG